MRTLNYLYHEIEFLLYKIQTLADIYGTKTTSNFQTTQ